MDSAVELVKANSHVLAIFIHFVYIVNTLMITILYSEFILYIYKDMERTDIYFVEDDTYFNNNVEGVEIHAECLSQDFDDIAWEPIVDDSPIVDPENDVFGYYN